MFLGRLHLQSAQGVGLPRLVHLRQLRVFANLRLLLFLGLALLLFALLALLCGNRRLGLRLHVQHQLRGRQPDRLAPFGLQFGSHNAER
ncbi:putative membrane protein [Xanthomonas translucens pv. poae]|uniref:Putative membrane protein n=1 Tax=Xanthomonas graminis pv. poae TaxID=227946 RepID=A0A0K3A0Q9_9XANT|nr:hypothetical protein [Xanthomonas translucens]CTP90887.1 putative membrane protein [Xanthomonas translucens pv. poae]